MQPSSLFRHMTSSSGMNQKDKEEDLGTLDQQVIILLQSELQNVPTLTCFTSIITPGHHFENDFSDPRSFYHFSQSYYLCYSLLTLANEASNFQFFPAHQKVNSFFQSYLIFRCYWPDFDWMFKPFPFFSVPQKQLLFLSTELETHVKCDIRESEKCLYRSKVSMI